MLLLDVEHLKTVFQAGERILRYLKVWVMVSFLNPLLILHSLPMQMLIGLDVPIVTTGYAVFFGGNHISWSAKKQSFEVQC